MKNNVLSSKPNIHSHSNNDFRVDYFLDEAFIGHIVFSCSFEYPSRFYPVYKGRTYSTQTGVFAHTITSKLVKHLERMGVPSPFDQGAKHVYPYVQITQRFLHGNKVIDDFNDSISEILSEFISKKLVR